MAEADSARDNVVELDPTQASRRERAKSGRRRRIVEAACTLLRDIGLEAVSGKLIAARAGVSLSTVYNLFGSKDAVLVAVFDQDLADYEALIRALPSQTPLERLFEAVEVAADLYERDPAFYRAVMWPRPARQPLDEAMRRPRNRFWQTLVQQAIDAGQLQASVDAAAVSVLLIRQFGGALSDWIADEISTDQLRAQVKFGFAAALLPFAARSEARALRERLLRLHDEIAQARTRAAVAGRRQVSEP